MEKGDFNISRNVRYDKFLQIECLAVRGKKLVERSELKKAKRVLLQIHKDIDELDILMKV